MDRIDEIKSSGLKATAPRIRILEVFQRSAQRHLTADDVFRLMAAEGGEVSLATVYRVLLQFEQAGLLTRHHFEGGRAVFELNGGHHHDHLVCLQCGHVEEFYDAEIESRQHDIAARHGFQLEAHALALYAQCVRPDCARRPSAPTA